MDILQILNWRYATKKFNPEKKLEENKLAVLLESVNLSATSYGLQPFRLLVIENPLLRNKLRAVSGDQSQITDASHLLVFAVNKGLTPADVDSYIERIAEVRGVTLDSLEAYRTKIKSSMASRNPEELFQWAARQAYIALGFLLVACASMEVDACPIEGIQKPAYDALLGLESKGYSTMVAAAVGYRADDDKYQIKRKVRKESSQLLEFYR